MKKTAYMLILIIVLAAINIPSTQHGNAQSPTMTPMRLGNGAINHVAWSPDGQYLAIASSYGTWIYDNDLNNPEQIWHETTETLEWTPDSKSLQLSVKRYVDGIAEKEDLLVDIETQTNPEIEDQPSIDWSLHHLCRRGYGDRHPTENKLVCVTRKDIVQLWDNEGQLLKELHTYMEYVGQITWGRNDYELVVYDRDKTRTQVWDVRTGELILGADKFLEDEIVLAWQSEPNWSFKATPYVAWTEDGSRFVTVTNRGRLFISDSGRIPLDVSGNSVSWSKSGTFLAVLQDKLYIWDVETQSVILERERTGLAIWNPVNDTCVLMTYDGIIVLDVERGTTQHLTLPEDITDTMYYGLMWLSNGNSILLELSDPFGILNVIWDVRSGEIINIVYDGLYHVAAYGDSFAGVYYCCPETRQSTSAEIVVFDDFGETVRYRIDLAKFTGQLSSVFDLQWNPTGEYLAAIVDQEEIYVFEWTD